MSLIAVYCTYCGKILDEGVVDEESSLLLWNDFTKIKEHLEHQIILRLKENCPKEIQITEDVKP